MRILDFVNNDKHNLSRRLLTITRKIEDVRHIEVPDPQTIILEGNSFDMITAVFLFRELHINSGLGWDVMELTLDPQQPYFARLSYKVARENPNNQLKFKIKVKDYVKEN